MAECSRNIMASANNDGPSSSDINDELLLKMICNYPAIYNFTQKGYSNRIMTDNAWGNVALSMGNSSVEDCKKRFKALREKYHREKTKCVVSSGSAHVIRSQWPHMSFFNFMYDNREPRKTSSSLPLESHETEEPSEDTYYLDTDTDSSVPVLEEEAAPTVWPVESDASNRPSTSSTKRVNSSARTISASPRQGKRQKPMDNLENDPFLGVLGHISLSMKNVATPTVASDKLSRFAQYVEAECRDLPGNVAEDFIDETLIRLLQVKRKVRNENNAKVPR